MTVQPCARRLPRDIHLGVAMMARRAAPLAASNSKQGTETTRAATPWRQQLLRIGGD